MSNGGAAAPYRSASFLPNAAPPLCFPAPFSARHPALLPPPPPPPPLPPPGWQGTVRGLEAALAAQEAAAAEALGAAAAKAVEAAEAREAALQGEVAEELESENMRMRVYMA